MSDINTETFFYFGKEIEGRLKGLDVLVLLSSDSTAIESDEIKPYLSKAQIFLLTLDSYSHLNDSEQREKIKLFYNLSKNYNLKFSLEVNSKTLKNLDKRIACDTHLLYRIDLPDNFIFSKLKDTDSLVFTTADDLLHNVYTLDSVSQLSKTPSHYYSFDTVVYE